MSTPTNEQREESTGVLVCHVYRDGSQCAYLGHSGDHPQQELDANLWLGGDWLEALVIHENEPPMPPGDNGLWELRWPWREPFAGEYENDELCCVFDGEPTWTLLVAAPATGAVENSPARALSRIEELAKDRKALIEGVVYQGLAGYWHVVGLDAEGFPGADEALAAYRAVSSGADTP